MSDIFIEDALNKFFETGILKCSTFQLNAIYTYVKKQTLEIELRGEDASRWKALSSMLFTYLTETEAYLSIASESLKVDFDDYLQKIYGISKNELTSENRDYVYAKYTSFIVENCCNKCLDVMSPEVCKTCSCGEIWE